MAPEVTTTLVFGGNYNKMVDSYSIGVTIFHM